MTKTFEMEAIKAAYARCYGLKYCVQNEIRGFEEELSLQTGLRQQYIIDNLDLIKKL